MFRQVDGLEFDNFPLFKNFISIFCGIFKSNCVLDILFCVFVSAHVSKLHELRVENFWPGLWWCRG